MSSEVIGLQVLKIIVAIILLGVFVLQYLLRSLSNLVMLILFSSNRKYWLMIKESHTGCRYTYLVAHSSFTLVSTGSQFSTRATRYSSLDSLVPCWCRFNGVVRGRLECLSNTQGSVYYHRVELGIIKCECTFLSHPVNKLNVSGSRVNIDTWAWIIICNDTRVYILGLIRTVVFITVIALILYALIHGLSTLCPGTFSPWTFFPVNYLS